MASISRFSALWSQVRLDLDDLGGEVILVDWGAKPPSLATRHSPSVRYSAEHAKNYKTLVDADKSVPPRMCQRQEFFDGDLTITLFQEAVGKFDQFYKRLVPLVDNPLILPLPPLTKDPVGADIKDIPRAVAAIQVRSSLDPKPHCWQTLNPKSDRRDSGAILPSGYPLHYTPSQSICLPCIDSNHHSLRIACAQHLHKASAQSTCIKMLHHFIDSTLLRSLDQVPHVSHHIAQQNTR